MSAGRLLRRFAGLALLALAAGGARADALVTSLSTHRVLISSNYTGAQITVFGQVERSGRTIGRADPYDIVITVTGPRRHLVVREKERVGPFWINTERHRYGAAPSFLSVLTSRPVEEMGSEQDARRLRIGLANQLAPPEATLTLDPDALRFRDALVRIKRADNLYREEQRGVTFLTPTLFRANIELPATAPTGNYEVAIELMAGTVLLARQQTNFEVVQIGFEQNVQWLAKAMPPVYGLATVALALLFGWFSTLIFRRD